jgi:hypothetical protein
LNASERELLQGRVRDVLAKGSISGKDLASVVRQTLRERSAIEKTAGEPAVEG